MSNVDQHKDKNDLLNLAPFETQSYDSFALTSLVAYGVFWIDQWGIISSYDNVAVICYKLFPHKFAMVGWPQFPDFNRVNRSILQMRPKYRNMAYSNPSKVILNDNGLKEASSLVRKLGNPRFIGEEKTPPPTVLVEAEKKGVKARSFHAEEYVDKMQRSDLYKLFSENRLNDAEAIELIEMLGVYDHTPPKVKRKKLNEFVIAAKELKDERAEEFLKAVSERFKRYLSDSPRR